MSASEHELAAANTKFKNFEKSCFCCAAKAAKSYSRD